MRASHLVETFERALIKGLDKIQANSNLAGSRSQNLRAKFRLKVLNEIYNVHFITFKNILEQ
ncbi:unnamed protein product, partial [marine sediment metagenome]